MRAHERWLIALIAVEAIVFSFTGANFLTGANAFEVLRMAVELGLLALALTPVIITGGIDLSVGSMMGLAAVVFGSLWRDHHFPIPAAAVCALLVGLAGGALNAVAITRFRIAPLIVTIGTYSLFRGLAEGLTAALDTFSNFPPRFLVFGQGPQVLVLAVAVVFYWILLHRTVIGRALYAIGLSSEGARYAGIPVGGRVALTYLLSGFWSSAAALIYVAHIGQAKSDAGTGYELAAITAVVLGGTSIFGGSGTIAGTVLGLFAIVVLEDGLRLSNMPAELAGILTGALLLAGIGLARIRLRKWHIWVAAFAAMLLAGMLIARTAAPTSRHVQIAMMPKAKGDPYFASCKLGADEAAKELKVDLLWDGPTDLDPAKQNEVVEGWITRHVDAIAVSVSNQAAISTVLRKALANGIRVLTWDADAQPDARDFFIDQATPQGIGYTLTDEAARLLNNRGEFAIITGALSAANQNEWIKYIRERLASKYPDLKLVVIRPCDDDRDRAFAEAQTLLKVYPDVKLLMGIAAPAVPGAAEAVKQAGRKDVSVIGLSLPNLCKPYVHDDVVQAVVLWNTRDLGYLTVYAANALVNGSLKRTDTALAAGRLGRVEVRGSDVILGAPFVFRKTNIDQFDF
ncbi:MAG TPA: substrate-binding domain-containing protein [Bryobacteraceae bacterium]|nr:substrate-binding domain-containing protein [Bryobacteraceae bacterium]